MIGSRVNLSQFGTLNSNTRWLLLFHDFYKIPWYLLAGDGNKCGVSMPYNIPFFSCENCDLCVGNVSVKCWPTSRPTHVGGIIRFRLTALTTPRKHWNVDTGNVKDVGFSQRLWEGVLCMCKGKWFWESTSPPKKFQDLDFISDCSFFVGEQDWHSPVYLGRLEYVGVHWSTFVHGCAVHFIVHLSTLWVQLGGWTDRPKLKTLNKI